MLAAGHPGIAEAFWPDCVPLSLDKTPFWSVKRQIKLYVIVPEAASSLYTNYRRLRGLGVRPVRKPTGSYREEKRPES